MYDVFISYSHKDNPAADSIVDYLARSGLRCYRDTTSIPGSAKWVKEITQAITACHAFVVIVSENSAVSSYVLHEVHLASQAAAGKASERLIPVYLSHPPDLPAEMKFWLGPLQHIDAVPDVSAILPSVAETVWNKVDPLKHEMAYEANKDVSQRANYSRRIRLAEDLCGLWTRRDDNGRTALEDECYVMEAHPERYLKGDLRALPLLTEFILEARIIRQQGPDDQWVGFEFGAQHPGNYYQFLLDGQGTVRISRHIRSDSPETATGSLEWEEPVRHANLRQLRRGNAENTLKVVRRGPEIHLFINSLHALSLQDMTIGVGGLGFIVGCGVRAAFTDIRVEGVDIDKIYMTAVSHRNNLNLTEAVPLLQYVQRYDPAYRHPQAPRDVTHLLAETLPDRNRSILIVLGHLVLSQLNDRAAAEKLRDKINRFADRPFEWAAIVTDTGLLPDTTDAGPHPEVPYLHCPLISIGGPAVNRITAHFATKLSDEMDTGAMHIQHNLPENDPPPPEEGEQAWRVLLWGEGAKETAEAVERFLSSEPPELLPRFLQTVWKRSVLHPAPS
jgi:hypothetical protein